MIHLINHPEAQTIEIREGRKGFWMKFRNGWGVSVQWDFMNYCDGYESNEGGTGKNAEIAVLLPKRHEDSEQNYLPIYAGGLLCAPDGMSEVWGYLLDYEVLRAMTIVSGFFSGMSSEEAYQTFVRDMAFGKEVMA